MSVAVENPFLPEVSPRTRGELIDAFRKMHAEITELWKSIPDEAFFRLPEGGGWSPAGNVRHLLISVWPITWNLKLPKISSRLLFGAAKRPGGDLFSVRDRYRAKLAAGGKAGPFTPGKRRQTQGGPEQRAKLMAQWERAVPDLNAQIEKWSEADLDHYRTLHPLIGRLTMREMLFFTLYHLSHHASVVAARQAATR